MRQLLVGQRNSGLPAGGLAAAISELPCDASCGLALALVDEVLNICPAEQDPSPDLVVDQALLCATRLRMKLGNTPR